MTDQEVDSDLAQRDERLIEDAGPERMRKLAHLLAPLVNPQSCELPETPQESRDAFIGQAMIGLERGTILLTSNKQTHLDELEEAALSTADLSYVISRESLSRELDNVIRNELMGRVLRRAWTPGTT